MMDELDDIIDLSPEEIDDLYQRVFAISVKLMNNGEKPLNLAGVLLAQAMRLYKTCLSEEDFLLMVEAITDTAKDVPAYNLDDIAVDSTTVH